MKKSSVAVLRVQPDTVLESLEKLFELAGGKDSLQKGTTTIIKDNLSWHMPYPSANTTPWQLEGAIRALKNNGYDDIVDVHNKTEVTDPFKGEKLNKFRGVLEKYDVPVKYNFKPEDMSWVRYRPKGKMLALHKIYGDNIRIPDYFIGKNIVHLPTVKCHIYTQTTGAMKNAFGGLLNHKRHQTHTYIHETLVDLLTIQKEIHTGLFCIMDGTTAGNGAGPRIMTPEKKDVILASADQVAVDAVSAKLMGFDPMSIPYIRLAHEAGLGTGKPDEIEIVGDTNIANESWAFEIPLIFHKVVANVTWFGPTKFLQKILTRPPLLYAGNFYSFFYHDMLHWPFKEKKVYQRWLKESEWGQLFDRYE